MSMKSSAMSQTLVSRPKLDMKTRNRQLEDLRRHLMSMCVCLPFEPTTRDRDVDSRNNLTLYHHTISQFHVKMNRKDRQVVKKKNSSTRTKKKKKEDIPVCEPSVDDDDNSDEYFDALPDLPHEVAWSQTDLQTLLQQMQSDLPLNDQKKYWKRVAKMDWQALQFGHFTGDDLQSKWTEIEGQLRTHRTLSELLQDAQEWVTDNIPPDEKADAEEQPLTPCQRYQAAKWEKYAARHPELSEEEVAEALTGKFDRLSDHRKQKYIDAYEEEMQEKKRLETQSKAVCPARTTSTRAEDRNSVMSASSSISFDKWNSMSQNSKEKYFDAEVKKGNSSSFCGPMLSLVETQMIQNLAAMMPKPAPRSGYSIFSQNMMKHLGSMSLIAEEWKKVPQKEKDRYHEQYKEAVRLYASEVESLKNSLKPDSRLLFETYVEKKSMKSIQSLVSQALTRLGKDFDGENRLSKTTKRKKKSKSEKTRMKSSQSQLSDTDSVVVQESEGEYTTDASQEATQTVTPQTKPRIRALKMTPLDEMPDEDLDTEESD